MADFKENFNEYILHPDLKNNFNKNEYGMAQVVAQREAYTREGFSRERTYFTGESVKENVKFNSRIDELIASGTEFHTIALPNREGIELWVKTAEAAIKLQPPVDFAVRDLQQEIEELIVIMPLLPKSKK